MKIAQTESLSKFLLFFTLKWNFILIETFSPALKLQKNIQDRSNLFLSKENVGESEEAERLKNQAEKLRNEIRDLESKLESTRPIKPPIPAQTSADGNIETEMSLKGKNVLVVGANGRLGSMVCRYLLRTHPQTNVIAAVHTVSENSVTSRGYGRLSYEVGAEDGIGYIGAAWSAEDRVASFEYDTETMQDYNLQNLRIVEAELLDPTQCFTITENIDSIIWCATDFNGNKPRAISGLNVAFFYRAMVRPDKGVVELEGIRNVLTGWLQQKRSKAIINTSEKSKDPTNFVLVSMEENAYDDFETPSGSFKSIKREAEEILEKEFPSFTHAILQMNRYDDNFVEENLDINMAPSSIETSVDEELSTKSGKKRRINRRDAAKAAVDALTNPDLLNSKVQVWTA